jgi:hypothetical protein
VDILEQNDQYSFSAHNYRSLKDEELNIVNPYMKQEYDLYELAKNIHFQTASVIVRAEIIKKEYTDNNQHDNFFRGSHHLFLTAARYGLVYYFNDVMSVYRVHSGGIVSGREPFAQYNDISSPHFKALLKDFGNDRKFCIIIFKNFVQTTLRIWFNKNNGDFRSLKLFDNLNCQCKCLNTFDRSIGIIFVFIKMLLLFFYRRILKNTKL